MTVSELDQVHSGLGYQANADLPTRVSELVPAGTPRDQGGAVATLSHLGHGRNVGNQPRNGHIPRDSRCCTGNFYIDEDVLREAGVTDFEQYAVQPGQPLQTDLFLGDVPAEMLGLRGKG